MAWHMLGTPAPDQLPTIREQLHCLAQTIASVPRLLAPPQDDWGHQAFDWDEDRQLLLSVDIPGDTPFRVALRIADATALVIDRDGGELASQPANGRTIDDLFAWLTTQTVALTGSTLPKPLTEAEDGLPEPCAAGQTFNLDDAALAELARYYADSYPVVQRIVAANDNAAPVRTWPHHMDMATSISLDPHEDPETARSISFGMQPGDGSYPEPYWYSSPWPYPELGPGSEAWPALDGGGRWHTEGFTAAVLLASDVVRAGDPAAQQQVLEAFATSAIEANRSLLIE